MTGQARVASRQRPLPIHLCLPPFLPTLHTLILHTSTCYALAQKHPVNNPRNCHPVTRLRENITRKTLQRVPARVPGNQSQLHLLFPNSVMSLTTKILCNRLKNYNVWHRFRHRSSSRVRKPVVESGSGGLGSVMSGNDSISATSVSSSIPSSQLVSTTGEEESASTATSATG